MRDKERRGQTAGHSLSGGRVSFRPKSRFRRDLVSCWTDSGSLKSTWPFGFRLRDKGFSMGTLKIIGMLGIQVLQLNGIVETHLHAVKFDILRRQLCEVDVLFVYILVGIHNCSAR